MIDRRRNRENINEHQIEMALTAIAKVTGRSPTYEFDDEAALRNRHAPK
ncbi:hypothetical protein [Paraburkholderia strydomiana]